MRPSHLFLGTNLDNRSDMFAKGRHPHGEGHGNAKLNWEQVHEIRVRNALGESGYSMSSEFGISPSQMSNIVRGRSYVSDRIR